MEKACRNLIVSIDDGREEREICYVKYLNSCSNFQPMGDTPACNRVWKSFTALLIAFSGNADQIGCSASLNAEIVLLTLIAACNNS